MYLRSMLLQFKIESEKRLKPTINVRFRSLFIYGMYRNKNKEYRVCKKHQQKLNLIRIVSEKRML